MNSKIYLFGKEEFTSSTAKKIYIVCMCVGLSLMYSMFVLVGCCLFFENEYLGGILSIAVPLIAGAVLIISGKNLSKSYALFSESGIEIHTFILLKEKIKAFEYQNIKLIYLIPGFSLSLKLKGVRFWFQSYYGFYSDKGKYMFKIAKSDDSESVVEALLSEYNLQLVEKH